MQFNSDNIEGYSLCTEGAKKQKCLSIFSKESINQKNQKLYFQSIQKIK